MSQVILTLHFSLTDLNQLLTFKNGETKAQKNSHWPIFPGFQRPSWDYSKSQCQRRGFLRTVPPFYLGDGGPRKKGEHLLLYVPIVPEGWTPKRYVHTVTPRACACDLTWKTGLCRWNQVKDLKGERLGYAMTSVISDTQRRAGEEAMEGRGRD